jgi:hypothetical protein
VKAEAGDVAAAAVTEGLPFVLAADDVRAVDNALPR